MTLIATDLDRTMIYSQGAIDADPTDAEVVCVEYYEGAPLSFMTAESARLLAELASADPVVPTTTRTIAQFQRIDLPGAPWRYAITSNGGNILVDGTPDSRWRADVDKLTADSGASLGEVTAALEARSDDTWVDKFRIADELFCYLVVHPERMPEGFLAEWDSWCRERGWNASQQGRKIYTMPSAVCKSRAITEVRARLVADGALTPGARELAAGDGALDAEMLMTADAAIRPRHGELEAMDWQHPGLVVTDRSGILAGEEILRWFAVERAHRGVA